MLRDCPYLHEQKRGKAESSSPTLAVKQIDVYKALKEQLQLLFQNRTRKKASDLCGNIIVSTINGERIMLGNKNTVNTVDL